MALPVTSIKRSQKKYYINTTPSGTTPTWAYINLGVSSLTKSKNPKVTTEGFIGDDATSTFLEGHQNEWTYEMKGKLNDPAHDFVENLDWMDAIFEAAETELLEVALYKPKVLETYPAKKYKVTVVVETNGDEAVEAYKTGVKLYGNGDPEFGTFNPSNATYVKNT